MITWKTYILIAIPLILSTITTPILGVVDTMVIGHLSNPAFIGGVAISVTIFNTLYWLFGFLRVSTTGMVAQAFGRDNLHEQKLAFWRPLLLAIAMGFIFIILQQVILMIATMIMKADDTVWLYAKQYFSIRIWGAPFALAMYVIIGWLIGAKQVRATLLLQLYMNILNIILCIVFVIICHMEIRGVALATVVAEITAPLIGLYLLKSQQLLTGWQKLRAEVFDRQVVQTMLRLNSDFFIRTACLLTAFTLFTSIGSSMSVDILAANTILFQLHFVFAYFFDGLANASSIYIGNAVGSNNKKLYEQTIRISFWWSFGLAIVLSVLFYFLGPVILASFTNIEVIYQLTLQYQMWLVLFPLVGFWALMLSGIFSGATMIAPIRNSHIWSLISYLLALAICLPLWGNHGLWFAFILFTLGRSLFLAIYQPRLKKLFV
ncbi:MATE family efflux transporter [Lysinibacillus sp. FSL H8-0500]|uniref:MATE family efflux transporter n=1 Tax=Lysinibacillus sp. FSL H8-0500 TaxID=2921393 RepID=UPI003100E93A